jgi:hypothetical protein
MTRSLHFIAIVVLAGGFAALRLLAAQPEPASATTQAVADVAPIGVLQSVPSLSAAQIDTILAGYDSPATGSGRDFYDLGVQYGIDPAYALAFFVHESTAGTNLNWDGMKPDGSTTHDIGNISCAGYPTCYGRWRDYADWKTGIDDWYRLINDEYIGGRGFSTVDQVIPVYAPSIENDVDGYTNAVSALVGQWRAEYGQQPAHADIASNPIAIGGDDCGTNVQVALEASGGALQDVQIRPGETFSFNATMGDPGRIPYRTCAGVPGGNWCNLAARYAQVSRALGLMPQFQDHGVGDLGGGPENSVAIWNEGGRAGGQDLQITNTLTRPVRFQAIIEGGSVMIMGGVE